MYVCNSVCSPHAGRLLQERRPHAFGTKPVIDIAYKGCITSAASKLQRADTYPYVSILLLQVLYIQEEYISYNKINTDTIVYNIQSPSKYGYGCRVQITGTHTYVLTMC